MWRPHSQHKYGWYRIENLALGSSQKWTFPQKIWIKQHSLDAWMPVVCRETRDTFNFTSLTHTLRLVLSLVIQHIIQILAHICNDFNRVQKRNRGKCEGRKEKTTAQHTHPDTLNCEIRSMSQEDDMLQIHATEQMTKMWKVLLCNMRDTSLIDGTQ